MRKGFTLVELIIVIAVLGVLTTVLLILINPLEQLARGRDASRKQAISQIGSALSRYYSLTSNIPTPVSLETTLLSSGEINEFPKNMDGVEAECTSTEGQGAVKIQGFCYNVSLEGSDPYGAILYTPLESSLEKGKCPDQTAWYAWSSTLSTSGVACTTSPTEEPTIITTIL